MEVDENPENQIVTIHRKKKKQHPKSATLTTRLLQGKCKGIKIDNKYNI